MACSSGIIGRKIFRYMRVTSTQDRAKRLAEKGVAEGTAVISETQSQGKGRLGRRWVSPKGGIWLSVILRPQLVQMEVPKITIIASLAVAEAIAELTGLEVKLKWPNDVLIHPISGIEFKKVCGVLTEMVSRVSRVNYIVVGIGINVNNRISSNLRPRATSLKEVIGRDLSVERLLKKVLEKFDKYYFGFKKGKMAPILREYKDRSAVLGREVNVELPDGVIRGKAIDIDEYGALIVKTEEGRRRVVAGDVAIISKIM